MATFWNIAVGYSESHCHKSELRLGNELKLSKEEAP